MSRPWISISAEASTATEKAFAFNAQRFATSRMGIGISRAHRIVISVDNAMVGCSYRNLIHSGSEDFRTKLPLRTAATEGTRSLLGLARVSVRSLRVCTLATPATEACGDVAGRTPRPAEHCDAIANAAPKTSAACITGSLRRLE